MATVEELVQAMDAEDVEASIIEALEPELRGDEVVLVKASRGVRLEVVVEGLEKAYAGGVV